jgi:single-stranded DNA-binding protein
MSAHVLVTGALFRQPEQRTSKAGKPFVTAKIRAKDGDSTQWWKVLAFSESAGAELLRLGDGDAVSAQGQLKAELYERDGETRLSLSIIADVVLALRQPAKAKSRPEGKAAPMSRRRRDTGVVDPALNDAVPF